MHAIAFAFSSETHQAFCELCISADGLPCAALRTVCFCHHDVVCGWRPDKHEFRVSLCNDQR